MENAKKNDNDTNDNYKTPLFGSYLQRFLWRFESQLGGTFGRTSCYDLSCFCSLPISCKCGATPRHKDLLKSNEMFDSFVISENQTKNIKSPPTLPCNMSMPTSWVFFFKHICTNKMGPLLFLNGLINGFLGLPPL